LKAPDLNWPAVVMFGCGLVSAAGFTLGVLKLLGIVKVHWAVPIGMWIVIPTGTLVGSLAYELRKDKKDADKDDAQLLS